MEEYNIAEAIKSGRIFKPIVAWCIGTCAKMFTSEVIITKLPLAIDGQQLTKQLYWLDIFCVQSMYRM